MLEVCLRLNVTCVSAYAFSIENFKRSQDEVKTLMSLAEEKLLELCQHGCVTVFKPRNTRHNAATGAYLMNTASV